MTARTPAPTVSVIIPAYNGVDLLPATIASLQAQTFGDFEVVIVDDRSTDDTLAMLHGIGDPRFRILQSPHNQGPVGTRNTAVAHARGRYIAGLDQDDLCHPDRLARQVAYLDANPATVVLATGAAFLDGDVISPAVRTGHTTPALIEWLLHIENPLVWSSTMIRAAAASDPFSDCSRLYAEDFDLYHRMMRQGRIARLDDALVVYRRHAGGVSRLYGETMRANSVLVLAEAYGDLFADDGPDRAREIAWLVVHHMMAQIPVPDGATLLMLGNALARLQARFLDQRAVSAEDRKLIRWETARRWGHTCRAGLRTGTIGLRDAVAARPDHFGLGHTGLDDLVLSRLIGGARSAKRRYAG